MPDDMIDAAHRHEPSWETACSGLHREGFWDGKKVADEWIGVEYGASGKPTAKGAIERIHRSLTQSIAAVSCDGHSGRLSTDSSAAPHPGFGLSNID
jgi:hypothetical protein